MPFSQIIIDNSFGSTSESASENARKFKHVIETLINHDNKVKKDAYCVNLYWIAPTNDEIDALVLLSKEELWRLRFQSDRFFSPRLSKLEISDIQSLKFCLKVLQEKGVYSVKIHFEYCSIENETFCDFFNDPANGSVLEVDQDPRTSEYVPYNNESY